MNEAVPNREAKLPEWIDCFPALRNTDDPVWVQTANRAKEVLLPVGYEVARDGDDCQNYIMVIEGITRVYKCFENGREMLLYRIVAGEACSLTTSLLLAGGDYTASAVVEEECRAVIIPVHDFHHAFDNSKCFRDFVVSTFGGRIRDFILLLESVATRNVDVRMARWMLENKTEDNQVIEVSHKMLAFELGTAREVVSRHLKEFEQNGWVKLSRKNIDLIDTVAMQELVEGLRS